MDGTSDTPSALILAGGMGTRFWPASRHDRPKQFLALTGEESLLRSTLNRVLPVCGEDGVWVCTTRDQAAAVEEMLPEVAAERILREPQGRNTAPAISWSLSRMPPSVREGIVIVLPADHMIRDASAFRGALEKASRVASETDLIVTLGVVPDRVETGYGYLELGEESPGGREVHQVVRFIEKPDRAEAERFLRSGRYLWNAGIFVFRGTVMLEHVRRLQPRIFELLEALTEDPQGLAERYAEMPSVSIDHGVMESVDELVTVPIDCGWSDLGSWDALGEMLPADEHRTRAKGDLVSVESHDNVVFAEEGTVALVGVSGLIVVRSGDTVLVVPRGRSQEVRRLVHKLIEEDRDDLL